MTTTLNADELAERWGKGRATIYRMADDDALPPSVPVRGKRGRGGRRWRIVDIEAYEQLEAAGVDFDANAWRADVGLVELRASMMHDIAHKTPWGDRFDIEALRLAGLAWWILANTNLALPARKDLAIAISTVARLRDLGDVVAELAKCALRGNASFEAGIGRLGILSA